MDMDENASRPMSQSSMMVAAACCIPKDDINKPQGDDAKFICLEKQTIGIADGVGNWSAKGIDAGLYARKLIKIVSALDNHPKGNVRPKMVLKEAILNTKAEGSSTACIIILTDQRLLRASHVGDSGFCHFRNNKLVGESQTKQKSFNRLDHLGKRRDSPKSY